MSPARPRRWTLAEFLDWEAQQGEKYEFDGFRPVAMSGGSDAHVAIHANLAISVGGRLRGKQCCFRGRDLKIEVAGRIRYPDGFVFCTPLARGASTVPDPLVVFEVLSPSSSVTDRIVKNREYRATPSVQRYVLLEQERIAATVFTREGDDWVGRLLEGDSMLEMPEIGLAFPFAELYADVDVHTDGAPRGKEFC